MREKLRGRRPSPAMIVSIIALVFALAGTGVASVATISALSKKDKKKVKNIAKNQADNQITARAPGLSVASANNANSANSANAANNLADQSQQIRAWASVASNGAVLASKNVNSVVQDGDGRYCFDLPFAPSAAVATLDGTEANLNHTILTATDAAPCPATHQDVRVFTGVPGGDSTVNQGFFIHIN
jgi:hypothetical protein